MEGKLQMTPCLSCLEDTARPRMEISAANNALAPLCLSTLTLSVES